MKTAYLTIDDGPTEITLQLLDALEERKMPAVLFFIGERMKQRPEIVVEAIQRGFPVGNHSWSHPHFSSLNVLDATLEIQRTEKIINELYQVAGKDRLYPCFRFPFGDKADGRKGMLNTLPSIFSINRAKRIQQSLAKLKLQAFDHQLIFDNVYQNKLASSIDWSWTFDIMEWSTSLEKPVAGIDSLEAVLKRISSTHPIDPRKPRDAGSRWLGSTSAEIILLHDEPSRHELMIPILNALKALPITFSIPPARSLPS